MTYIYDLLLNYNDNILDFYEWCKDDRLITVEKIPVFKVSSTVLNDFINNKIKISLVLLNKIKNKTFTNVGSIKYSCLITDLRKVIALKFNDLGEVIGISSLLLDEEDDVIDEVECVSFELFEYEILSKYQDNYFLTRREKKIRSFLLEEISFLYQNKDYDELNYLYDEVYSDEKSIMEKYNYLIQDISNNYDRKYEKLYEIIKMVKKKEACASNSLFS